MEGRFIYIVEGSNCFWLRVEFSHWGETILFEGFFH